MALIVLVAIFGGLLLVRSLTGDDPSPTVLVDTLIEAQDAAAGGTFGREFFLDKLEDPLHALEGRLSRTDDAAGERLRRAISLVESAVDGHVVVDGRGSSSVEVVEALTVEVCLAVRLLGDAVPRKCS